MRIEGPKRFLFLLLQKACAERGPTEKQEAESIKLRGPQGSGSQAGKAAEQQCSFFGALVAK